jgi:hypothetical protein
LLLWQMALNIPPKQDRFIAFHSAALAVKFSESNRMVMMWVSRAPVERIKQFVL